MQAEDRRMIRAVVRRVHPDLFAAHPYERAKNTESLKVRFGVQWARAMWTCTLFMHFAHVM